MAVYNIRVVLPLLSSCVWEEGKTLGQVGNLIGGRPVRQVKDKVRTRISIRHFHGPKWTNACCGLARAPVPSSLLQPAHICLLQTRIRHPFCPACNIRRDCQVPCLCVDRRIWITWHRAGLSSSQNHPLLDTSRIDLTCA